MLNMLSETFFCKFRPNLFAKCPFYLVLSKACVPKKYFSCFSTKTFVVGTQNLQLYPQKFSLSKPMVLNMLWGCIAKYLSNIMHT